MQEILSLAERVLDKAKATNIKFATAESCTGGMLSSAITSIAGSSSVFERGFITYSYDSKIEMLGVSKKLLENEGAVNDQCVEEMAVGAVQYSKADMAVSISGIAGPDGGSEGKPVGLVYFGYLDKATRNVRSEKRIFEGTRNEVQQQATMFALELFLRMMNER